jgi:anaerobic dimethyl sulfoxide reductase subunit B (iron-sulfur subunit)
MCNFCLDRLEERKKPICVAGCPMRALDSGPLEELKAKYGDAREAEGLAYSDELKPSVLFKPKFKGPSS